MTQRAAFCVYSGKGVIDLRNYLAQILQTMQRDGGEETEYEDEYEDDINVSNDEVEMTTGDDDDIVYPAPVSYNTPLAPTPHATTSSNHSSRAQTTLPPHLSHAQPRAAQHHRQLPHRHHNLSQQEPQQVPRQHLTREVPLHFASPVNNHNGGFSMPATASSSTQTSVNTLSRSLRSSAGGSYGFGQLPVIEASGSPAPSDGASNRSSSVSAGAFFRTYPQENNSARSHGAQTPDLVYAEMGHGRGTASSSPTVQRGTTPRVNNAFPPNATPLSYGSDILSEGDDHTNGYAQIYERNMPPFLDPSDSRSPLDYHPSMDSPVLWPPITDQPSSDNPTIALLVDDLHDGSETPDSADFQMGGSSTPASPGASSSGGLQPVQSSNRGRSVKRSIRNTLAIFGRSLDH